MSGLTNIYVDLTTSTTTERIIQKATVAADNLGNPATGTEEVILSPDNDLFSLTAKPFDRSLGNLDSFTVLFSDFRVEATGSAATFDAGIHGSFNGNFSIDGFQLSGFGTSGSRLAGQLLKLTFPDARHKFNTVSSSFSVSINEGLPTNRDPAILAAVCGDRPFEVQCDASPKIGFTAIEDGIVSATGTISITYEFTPFPPRQSFSLRRIGKALAGLGLRKRHTTSP